MATYYIRNQGRVIGPVALDKLLEMKAKGQLRQFHEISVDRFKWHPASEFEDLFPSSAAPLSATSKDSEEGPTVIESRPPRRPRSRGALVAGLVILLLVVGGVVAGIWYYQTHKEQFDTGGVVSGQNEEQVGKAVGLVACGIELTGPRGDIVVVLGGTGSCFAVSPHGHLLTNKHVIEEIANLKRSIKFRRVLDENAMSGEPRVWVYLNKKRYDARILHVDDDFDLGILKIDHETPTYFALRDGDKIARHTSVSVYGFPGELRQTAVTEDELIKNVNPADLSSRGNKTIDYYFKPRDLEFSSATGTVSRMVNEEVGRTRVDRRLWIEHTATINPGNSGGPLVDEQGLVVGINTLMAGKTNIYWSLALPQLRAEIDKHVNKATWK